MNEGWFALFGAALVIIGSIIREALNNRGKIKLEKIKIHDKDKLEAYKNLFNFARSVTNTYYPLANNEVSDFIRIMKGRFEQEIKTVIKQLGGVEHMDVASVTRTWRAELINKVDYKPSQHEVDNVFYSKIMLAK